MPATDKPRWGAVGEAAAEWGEPPSTVRRWAAQGRIPARRIGRKYQIDLNALDQMREPARPARWLTEADERLAREVARALLPLTPEQRDRLSLLLHPGRGRRGAA